MAIKDIKLTKTSEGIYDISFTSGDFTLDDGLETSFLMTCYCQRRNDEIEDPRSRGGWAGNQLNTDGFEQGSLVWTLFQEKADDDAANLAQNYLEDAFQWYLDDGIAKEINIDISLDNEEMTATIEITRNDDTQFTLYYDLWVNTVESIT